MDEESATLLSPDTAAEFSDKMVRQGFIRKVYGILSLQLILTIGVIAFLLFVPPVKLYMEEHGLWLWIVSLIGLVISLVILACCEGVRRTWPANIICLFIFTTFESIFLGAVASNYDSDAVIMAAGITAVITVGLSIFALQTKWDFTMCGGFLMVFLFALFGFGILCAIIRSQYLNILYSSLGALLFGFYLVFDTQLMLRGKHKYSISPEEYIFAALNLYLDIINIFLYILAIIQSSKSS